MAQLWENLQFWKKQSMKIKEFKDYRLFDYQYPDGRNATGIELFIKGYEGVLYHYQEARVVEEGEFGRLQFGYTLLEPGEHSFDELQNDENFVTIMGEILTQVLLKKIDDETGKNDSKKLGV